MFGIDMTFWIGMGIIAVVVVIGCAVAWLMPPQEREDLDAQL